MDESKRARRVAGVVLSALACGVVLGSCGGGDEGGGDTGGGPAAGSGGAVEGGAGTSGTGGGSGTGATAGTAGSGGAAAAAGSGATGGQSSGGTGGAAGQAGTAGASGSAGAAGSPPAGFRFISWADTKTATSVLSSLSDQATALKPAFTIYPGDLVESWSTSNIAAWKGAIDGTLTDDPVFHKNANGMFDIVFPVRGNHEGSSSGFATWMGQNHAASKTAAKVGATQFASMPGNDNLVYSFDYGNAHVVGLDALGNADELTSAQLGWLDTDLGEAEKRGLAHAFLFFHGAIYCVANHCSCSTGLCNDGGNIKLQNLIAVTNKHAIVAATFHGHEHLNAHTLLDGTRDSSIKHAFHQFVTGDAGAGPTSCTKPGRYDWCLSAHGFATVDISGKDIVVTYYKQGDTKAQKVFSFTH
jgi:hypothetical protein